MVEQTILDILDLMKQYPNDSEFAVEVRKLIRKRMKSEIKRDDT